MTIKTERLYRKKIGLYTSVRNHYSLVEVILRSLRPLEAEITLFAPEGLMSQYSTGWGVSACVAVSQKKMLSAQQIKEMNAQDFMIFDQPYSFRELAAFSWFRMKTPRLLMVHDCHSWFMPQMPKSLKNYLKYYFTNKIKRKFTVFGVAGSNMKRYLNKRRHLEDIFLVPFRYADFDPIRDSYPPYVPGNLINICIPGTISERRNYLSMLEVLCIPALKDKIVLRFLGRPVGAYGKKAAARIDELRQAGFHIHYAEQYIPDSEFEELVRKADLLLSDFDPRYQTNNGQTEIYGLSKETGVAVLMLNKAKAGVLPASFQQMKEIENQTLTFGNLADLPVIIQHIYQGRLSLAGLQRNALANAADMDIEKVTWEFIEAYQLQTDPPATAQPVQ